MKSNQEYDVIVIGGGAAGLMCALIAGQRGRKVLLLEKTKKLGKKILMSGGGHCNFTNLDIQPDNFICDNPHFVKSALAQYTQWDFISMVAKHNIDYVEKKHQQLFCDASQKFSSKDILAMLEKECEVGQVNTLLNCTITALTQTSTGYQLSSDKGQFSSTSVVIATGGLSIPTLGGATAYGYQVAEQFGLTLNPSYASLVPMTLTGQVHAMAKELSGVSLDVIVSVPNKSFAEDMLFTHRGISGPAILQLSNYWKLGEEITVDLLPKIQLASELKTLKQSKPNSLLNTVLGRWLPKSFIAEANKYNWFLQTEQTLHSYKNESLEKIAEQLHNWKIKPSGTEGYRTAEVTMGGVSTNQISSKTMQVNKQKGLYFIGEALDVTGHLGGYNFQWAWSSGYVAGVNV